MTRQTPTLQLPQQLCNLPTPPKTLPTCGPKDLPFTEPQIKTIIRNPKNAGLSATGRPRPRNPNLPKLRWPAPLGLQLHGACWPAGAHIPRPRPLVYRLFCPELLVKRDVRFKGFECRASRSFKNQLATVV